MKIIEQSYEICESNDYTIQDVYKDIERAARVSYKSEDRITEDSAEKMVNRLVEMGHLSPLEFGTIYLTLDENAEYRGRYGKETHSKVRRVTEYGDDTEEKTTLYITTNYRVIVEHGWFEDLKYLTAPTENHYRRTTVKFITNRSVSHELVRHRSMSFMQESQRYCNYNKDKFDNQITFIKPTWYDTTLESSNVFDKACLATEEGYLNLIKEGLKPQEARSVLPNACKTELYMCGFDTDWSYVFELRDKETVDPMMYDIIHKLHKDFEERWTQIN